MGKGNKSWCVLLFLMIIGVVSANFTSTEYNPAPGTHLYYGYATNFSDSDFPTQTVVTTGLSDNSTSTKYETQLAGVYVESETPFNASDIVLLQHFNNDGDENSTLFKDRSGFGNDGTCTGASCPTITSSIFDTGVYHDGNDDQIHFGNDSSLNSFTDGISFGFWFKPEGTYTQWMLPIYKGSSGWGDWGIGLNIDDGWALVKMANSTGSQAWCGHYGASLYDIGEWVFFAGSYNGTHTTLHVQGLDDAEMFTLSCTFISGNVLNNPASPLQTGAFGIEVEGNLDELFVINDSLTKSEMEEIYDFTARNLAQGKVISARYSETYDSDYNYFLNFNVQTSGNHSVFVHAYENSDDVSESQYVTQNFSGTGYFNINVSSLMDYMTNNQSLSFSQFRVYTDYTKNISEVFLVKEINDTTAPTIANCTVLDADSLTPQTDFECLEGIRFQCEVTDNADVDNVIFQIDGVNYTAMQNGDMVNGDTFYHEFYPDVDTNGTTYTLENVYAEDINGQSANTTENLDADFECDFDTYLNIDHTPVVDVIGITNTSAIIRWSTDNLAYSQVDYGLTADNLSEEEDTVILVTDHLVSLSDLLPNTVYFYNVTSWVNPSQTLGTFNFTTTDCIEDWVATPDACLANNTQFLYYTDNNACGTTYNVPVDNGTYQSCNFCDPVLRQEYTSECYRNGSLSYRNYTTIDDNYYSCCVFSQVPLEDCPTDYAPYNSTQTEFCTLGLNDFDVDYDSEVYFGLIPDRVYWKIYINQSNKTYRCLSYIKTHQQNMLQSNPQYTAQSDTLIRFRQSEYEDREYFTVEKGIGNIYFTKENLVVDGREYIFGVECSDGQGERLISERFVRALYEPVNEPITRFFWVRDNVFGIVTFIVLSVIVGLAIAFWWRSRN